MQAPSLGDEVHARLGVLDDRPVLDIGADLPWPGRALFGPDLHDVVQGPGADDGIGANPEGCVEGGAALVLEVLQVGRHPGDAFQGARGAAVGGVGRLDDRHPFIPRLLQVVHEADTVVRHEQGVGIQGQDVVGSAHHPVWGVPWPAPAQDQLPVTGRVIEDIGAAPHLLLDKRVTHEPDVGVEVYGFVRLVGQGRIALALEHVEGDGEDVHQPADKGEPQGTGEVEPPHVADLIGDLVEVARKSEEDLVDKELVGVVNDLLSRRH